MEENNQDAQLPAVDHALIEKIKNYFKQQFEPTQMLVAGTVTLTTQEIYVKMQSLYLSECYGVTDVAEWLHDWGYSFTDMGQMRYEWMLQPSS